MDLIKFVFHHEYYIPTLLIQECRIQVNWFLCKSEFTILSNGWTCNEVSHRQMSRPALLKYIIEVIKNCNNFFSKEVEHGGGPIFILSSSENLSWWSGVSTFLSFSLFSVVVGNTKQIMLLSYFLSVFATHLKNKHHLKKQNKEQ